MQINYMKKSAFALFFALLGGFAANAQDTLKTDAPEDTVASAVARLTHEMDALKKIKISGYVQAQFQEADSAGAKTYEGGDFAPLEDKRFMIRRGRVKVAYVNALTQGVVQIDATEKGMAMVEAYMVATEPWLRAFSITAGVFNRPFGYEIPYSSSLRESPERGRMSQIIMPGERDLGAMITFQMPKDSPWNWLKIQGGMFNGTGRNAVEFDTQKDFIGQLVITRSNKAENFKYSGGLSYYDGGVRQFSKKVWTMGTDSLSNPVFIVDSTSGNVGKYATRQYMGADAQFSLSWVGGTTTLRGEYIQGTQAGTSSSTTSFTAAPSSTTDMYIRHFNGAYFYFIQNILQSKHTIVVKYDWYDPNTDIAGDQIKGGSTKTGAADIKFTTLGLGYIFHWDQNVKLMAYYDLVKNETSKNLTGYHQNILDEVFTLRMQYKF